MSVMPITPATRAIRVGDARVAYRDAGAGETVLLLHGCPFSSFVWRHLITRLGAEFRCVAPDLLGLGDTETPAGADWSLPAQAAMIVGFLDRLGVERAHVVGHDHGGALAQLLAAEHPERLDRLVLANAEAYDNWPSRDERPFVYLTQVPLIGDVVMSRGRSGRCFASRSPPPRPSTTAARSPTSCSTATSPPTSPAVTAAPRPNAFLPDSSTPATTASPSGSSTACDASTTPHC